MKEKLRVREFEALFKALANKRRIGIILCLKKKRSRSVGDIAEEIKLSFKATSKHLIILLRAGFIEREQIGLMMIYRLHDSDPYISKLLKFLS